MSALNVVVLCRVGDPNVCQWVVNSVSETSIHGKLQEVTDGSAARMLGVVGAAASGGGQPIPCQECDSESEPTMARFGS